MIMPEDMMIFNNAFILTESGYIHGGLRVENGVFVEVFEGTCSDGTDLNGAKIIPGLVDIHTHGNSGHDFSDGDLQGLKAMSGYLARHGITSFTPASMTLPYEALDRAFRAARDLHDAQSEGCAKVIGIHMEGPFFSFKKKGAQNAAFLKEPDIEAFRKLYESSGGLIRIVDIAPELPGSADFIKEACKLCRVSVAHTDADYEEAAAAYDEGASHLTHLFNAMPQIHHRKPGVIGAASEREYVTAELICDGIHVHPSSVRMAFRLFPGRICLISDALRCCGMPDGEYMLGGQKVCLENSRAHLEDGTIAGSAVNLFDCVRQAVRFGIPEISAIRAASIVPARVVKEDARIGSIEPGKAADFLVCDEELNLLQTFINGVRVQ